MSEFADVKSEDGRPSPRTLGGSVLATVLKLSTPSSVTLLTAKLSELMGNACEVLCTGAANGKHYAGYVTSETGRQLHPPRVTRARHSAK